MSELERSTVVLQALDTLSGFNSALAIQVNSTRQDVRITREKLREEERQNREAQQSLEHFSREVESERQLLFEAMAYLNEDVRLPVPDIEKIQSDIKRLKDFIAYKVNHSDEERVQYRSQNGSLVGGTPPNRKERKGTKGFLQGTNFDDTTPYNLHGNNSTRDDSRESTRDDMNISINQAELDQLKIDTMRLKEEAILAKTQAEESRSKLDISEAQAASFIGKIVAEKESLSGDRDMLIQQITNSSTEIGVLKETVLSLKKKITESNTIIQKLNHDLVCEHEVCVNKDMMIKEQKEDIIQYNLMSTTDLTKISEELVESLKENGTLGNHVQTLEEVLCKERAAREKERQALSLALSNIDDLASKLKTSQIKNNELDDNNNKLTLLQQEYDELGNENLKFQKDIMLLHSQLNQAEENITQCELKIDDLREEKKEFLDAEEKENFNHKNKISELEMIIANFEISIKNNEIASNLKFECYQNEIDRLSYELQKSENEIYQKHELNTKFQIDIRNLEEKHNKEMEEKIKNENLEKMVKRSAEVQLTVGELVLSLQANRLLSEEIIILKNKLDKEEKKRKLIEENSIEKISSKTSELDSVIESNKYALVRASSQINDMKISLTDLKREKEEIERRFQNSETYTETVRTSLQEAMNELEKIMLSKKALQKELFRVIQEREEEVVLKVSTDAATAEAERVALLRAELVHMTQLKEIAETRAAALTLINTGNATRSFDNVHSLSVRTGDYTGHTEDDVYSQQPMDFNQYKRFTASISNNSSNNNNNTHSVTHPNNHPLASEMVSNGYTYPPLPTPPHRSYALDDFQGSDDSYAANLAGHRNGQRPARYVGMTRNIPNGTPKPYTESVTRYNGSEPVTVPSPRSRVDRNYLNGDVAASRGHGLSSSLCNGYASRVVQEDLHAHAQGLGQGLGLGQGGQGGMEQRRGEGVGQGQGQGLKEMTKDRGCGRHSPTPSPPSSISRNHIEEALRMSDDESDDYFTVSARNEQNRANERNALNGVHERNGSNNDKIDEETKLSLSNTAKESIEEKSDTSSPVSDRSCSPVTRRKKMKIKSPWVNTFKASPNWNYSPPIQKNHTMGEAEEGQEELAGTPPKDTVDPAGKHSKEYRSIDDYFLQ